ncbi:hypothetical protein ACFYU5_35975 [Nocardia aobensis]|uniref:Extradiol ring-cleavage dioxygenase class III enzyme subunit B domain-containing protein n=1 Tax=Nocardia aobensis TaxID=257277 RepID=A0ABW6PFI0_9NOCA
MPPYETSGHHDLGRHLLEAGLRRKFDLAASDTYRIDHGFTVPLSFVRPEQDLPVIPVWTNILIPPLPPGERYFELGAALRESIEEFPGDLRVAMLATGHMTNSVGGPAMLSVVEEPVNAWDLRTWELFTTGRVVELLPDCTWDELYKHGNGTPGFMVHLVAWGAVHGAVPSWSHLVSAPIIPPAAFVSWDESSLTRKVEK